MEWLHLSKDMKEHPRLVAGRDRHFRKLFYIIFILLIEDFIEMTITTCTIPIHLLRIWQQPAHLGLDFPSDQSVYGHAAANPRYGGSL